jgi:aldehyde dehydrogenase (NAD+)
MRLIDKIYIGGEYITPRGEQLFDLYNPAKGEVVGRVRLGNAEDTRHAISAAKRAFPAFSRSTKQDRIGLLHTLHDVVAARENALAEAMIVEYGAPLPRAYGTAKHAAQVFLDAVKTLESYDFNRRIGAADVVMMPIGVVGLITPWNANAGFICSKLSMAIAAGCTAVIKPSEMSAIQTEAVIEALHAAGLPPGVFNVVNGLGDVVGAEISISPDIAKISFTGSTAVGKTILKAGAETLKRVTLELGGKSPSIVLDDADLEVVVPLAIDAGFINSGQACLAGTRILVPEGKLDEVSRIAKSTVENIRVGDPRDPKTVIGPMVSEKQWRRVQDYLRLGTEEGAHVLVGGVGKPPGLEDGYFVNPTVFVDVKNDMRIAREEIFGPVLSIITYRDEEEAIRLANDTTYGLQAYVFSRDVMRAERVASQIDAGRVAINGIAHEPLAPFGGFKQSGIGRELGVFGLETYLEPKTLVGGGRAAA